MQEMTPDPRKVLDELLIGIRETPAGTVLVWGRRRKVFLCVFLLDHPNCGIKKYAFDKTAIVVNPGDKPVLAGEFRWKPSTRRRTCVLGNMGNMGGQFAIK